MELQINSSMGSMKEEIDINKEGKDIMIGFNPKFLIDALRVIDDEEISIYLVNPKAPCFIRNEEESYIYLILPVNLQFREIGHISLKSAGTFSRKNFQRFYSHTG